MIKTLSHEKSYTLLLFFSCEKNENIDIEPIQTSQMSLSDLSASDLPYGLDKLIFENKSHSQDGFKSRTIENGDADFKSIIGVNDDKLVKHMWVNGFTSYSAPLYVALDSERVLFGSSCAIFIPENTELIIYARKNQDGKYSIGMCSGLLYLTNSNFKRQKRELEILKMFKSKNIRFTDKINYSEKAKLHGELEQFKGIELDKDYGMYEITFASDLTIKNVIEISGFGNPVDKKLIEIIKKTEWTSFGNGLKNKVPENSKLFIGIYFYPKEKGNPSFLSQYYL